MKKGIGVIGCSRRIEGLLNRLLEKDEDVEIRGLRDPDEDRIDQLKSDLAPNAEVYDSDEAIATADDIDWIAVGSWNSLHASQAITAFRAGKDVFCEKPLATNFEDCLKIQKAYQQSQCKLMIGFTLRYTWQYRKIKELIDNDAIGDIVSFEFNETLDFNHGGHIMSCWRRKREYTGCHILEKCCHDIDLANWMVSCRVQQVGSFGGLDFFQPENESRMDEMERDEAGHKAYCGWPTAHGGNPFATDKDIVDNQVCIMEFQSGTRATFHTNLNAGIPERRMYILGTNGAIRADLRTGEIELRRIGYNEESEFFTGEHKGGHGGGDAILVDHWSRMIHDDAPSLTDLKTGIESAVACFAMDEARRENKIINLSDYWRKLDQSDGTT